MKLISIDVADIDNAGCDNGNYPAYLATFDDGSSFAGMTCRCHHGCSGMDDISDLHIGDKFQGLEEFVQKVETE